MITNLALLLRNEEVKDGWRTFANMRDGEKITLTYNFRTVVPKNIWTEYGDPNDSFQKLSAVQTNVIEHALQEISSVAGVTFAKSESQNADVMFGTYSINTMSGYTSNIIRNKTDGSAQNGLGVWLTTDQDYSGLESIGYLTALHEVLHVLGLEHSFDGPLQLPKQIDNTSQTVMSYKLAPFGRISLKDLDIIALQSVYGPPDTKLENTVHVFGSDKVIFDGGGIDTLSASKAHAKAVIDLNGGTWNWIGSKAEYFYDDDQFWIGHFTDIENAIGSKFNDVVRGNALDNLITGGRGNDRLEGRDGGDALKGDAGKDTICGGEGNDKIYGGIDNDALWGNAGDDAIYGQQGNDRLIGGLGADKLFGSAGKDLFVFRSFDEMGTLTEHDQIRDFRFGDRIDLRSLDADASTAGRQKLTFLGNAKSETKLGHKAGQFYFNTKADELRFDADGDGHSDYAIGVKGVAVMITDYFLL